jgi:hypothetical protein
VEDTQRQLANVDGKVGTLDRAFERLSEGVRETAGKSHAADSKATAVEAAFERQKARATDELKALRQAMDAARKDTLDVRSYCSKGAGAF